MVIFPLHAKKGLTRITYTFLYVDRSIMLAMNGNERFDLTEQFIR